MRYSLILGCTRWELTETLYQAWVRVRVRREGVLQKCEVNRKAFSRVLSCRGSLGIGRTLPDIAMASEGANMYPFT